MSRFKDAYEETRYSFGTRGNLVELFVNKVNKNR